MESVGYRTGLPRSFEIAVSVAGLIVLAPLILIASAAIAVTSGRPVFFRQKRIGQQGRVFVLNKLRTMKSGPAQLNVTAGGDPRITPVGRILRQTKIDEIPELWNVLTGDMSLVGPRPEVPAYVDFKLLAWQKVLRARPGITDPVTLRLRNEEKLLARVIGDPEKFYLEKLQPLKLAGYLEYLDKRTWRSDLATIFRTLECVLFPSRAPVNGANNQLIRDVLTISSSEVDL
jgi:lipopolysaccharide/colanic/teichoic acid biosynthesis glycosyltransferase